MADASEDRRREAQSKALELYPPTGAVIYNEYLVREQEVVGVNKSDLEDIMTFDGIEALFTGVGLFLLSGAVWLGIDKLLSQSEFQLTPLLSLCGVSSLFGLMSVVTGFLMRKQKRAKISRIFAETKPIEKRSPSAG
jgi:hypothetical protein